MNLFLGGLVTIIGSDGKPTQVPASTLPMPPNLNVLSGVSNAAALGSYTKFYYLNTNDAGIVNRYHNL